MLGRSLHNRDFIRHGSPPATSLSGQRGEPRILELWLTPQGKDLDVFVVSACVRWLKRLSLLHNLQGPSVMEAIELWLSRLMKISSKVSLMIQIQPHPLFLGNALEARDLRLLFDHRISAVVDLAMNETPAQLAREVVYFRIPLHDGADNPDELLETAIRSLAMLIELKLPTLVACSAGLSRSPSIAAAALAMVTHKNVEECLSALATLKPLNVSPSLWSQTQSVYKRIRPRL